MSTIKCKSKKTNSCILLNCLKLNIVTIIIATDFDSFGFVKNCVDVDLCYYNSVIIDRQNAPQEVLQCLSSAKYLTIECGPNKRFKVLLRRRMIVRWRLCVWMVTIDVIRKWCVYCTIYVNVIIKDRIQ
jgi:hypothetical protein